MSKPDRSHTTAAVSLLSEMMFIPTATVTAPSVVAIGALKTTPWRRRCALEVLSGESCHKLKKFCRTICGCPALVPESGVVLPVREKVVRDL